VNVSFDKKESTSASHPAQLLITLSSDGATGPAGSNGTGINPSGIPLAVAGHAGRSTFFSPASSIASTAAAFRAGDTVVAMTLTSGASSAGAAPGADGFYSAFSCQ
jgi:hypothetical protein